MIELAWDIAWDLAWLATVALDYSLWISWNIVTFTFDTLPTLIVGAYDAIVAALPLMKQTLMLVKDTTWFVLDASMRIVSVLGQLQLKDKFARVASAVGAAVGPSTFWDESASGVPKMDPYKQQEYEPGIIYTLLGITIFVVILVISVTCMFMLVHFLYPNNERASSPRQPDNRVANLHQQRRSRSRSTSLEEPDSNFVLGGRRRSEELRFRGHAHTTGDEQVDNIRQIASQPAELSSVRQESVAADTDLLRRQLHEANEELSREKDKTLCAVCMEKEREVLLKPCNHYCLCVDCSQKKDMKKCPMCMKTIEGMEKIYHS